MKNIVLTIHFVLLVCFGNAQNFFNIDTLNKALAQAKNDTARFYVLRQITVFYTYSKPDTALMYAQQASVLAKKIKSDISLSDALRDYAGVLSQTGNYPQAIYFELESLKLAEKSNNLPAIGWCYGSLANTYIDAEDHEHALFYARKAKSVYELHPNLYLSGDQKQYWNDMHDIALGNLATIYDKLNLPDSALAYLQMINRDYNKLPGPSVIFYWYGNVYFTKGDYPVAISYYRRNYQTAIDWKVYDQAMLCCNGLAKTFRKINLTDSGIFYAKKVLELNNYAKHPKALLEALDLLANVYKSKGNNDSTVKYLQLAVSTKDSLFNQQKLIQMQTLTFNEQLRQQDILAEQKAYRDKLKAYILIGGSILILISAGLLFFYRYRIKQLKNLQSVKSRIASDLHDDIGATLTNINILAELSKQNFNKTGNADTYLNRISEEINTTSQALDDIIWSVNVHDDSFDEIILRMRRYAGELFDADKTNYTIQLDEKLSSMKLNMEQRRDLYLLFKESVNNIHKHAAATNVSISITGEDHSILMKVEDDGKGFCRKETPRNGLKNMQSRVQKWKGEMQVETVQDKGTRLFFTFPVK
ncbi:MAG TPA: tetratricopeptide repeat protein [Parafilimonas sp.]|nr:tetratricopeptide repeat protein [Parafilimonas sp.]